MADPQANDPVTGIIRTRLGPVSRPHNIKIDGMNIQVIVPWYVSQTVEAGGHLINNAACMACWYYYLIAEDACQKVGDGFVSDHQILTYDIHSTIMDMPQWMDKRYNAQANSVARMYGIPTLDEMFAYWPQVVQEAAALGMPNPRFEYMNPKTEDKVS